MKSHRHTRRNGETLAHEPYTQRHPQPAGAELCGQICHRASWRGDGQKLLPATLSRHFHLDISVSTFTWVRLGFLKKTKQKKNHRTSEHFFFKFKTSLGISMFLMCVCVRTCMCVRAHASVWVQDVGGGQLEGEGSCC